MNMRELMTMVGRKRFTALLVLLILCGVLGGAWQKWLIPEFDRLTAEKNTVQRDRFRLQQDIRDLPSKFELLKANETRYDALAAAGFTGQQDRIEARRIMNALRLETGVRGLTYDITPQKKEVAATSVAPDMDLFSSDIKVTFKALSDIEMRDFIERIQTTFKGLIVVDKVAFERKVDPTPENLAQLSGGTPVDFVEGEALLHWYNLMPKEAVPNATGAPATGGLPQ